MNNQIINTFLTEVPLSEITLLVIFGICFGIAYTYIHFWTMKRYVLPACNMKGVLFLSTLIRLIIFFGALLLVSFPNHAGLRVMIFFVFFMIGRIFMLKYARKEIL